MTGSLGGHHCTVVTPHTLAAQAVSRPFAVCPVCLRKVHDSMRAVGMDLAEREQAVCRVF